MPELRDVRPQAAIRAFERAGGRSSPGRGDHVKITMPNGAVLTLVGGRRPIKVGLLVAMIKKSGMTVDQFAALLR